jgi:hypothetical protein
MISAKIQIDCLLKSSKIVIFLSPSKTSNDSLDIHDDKLEYYDRINFKEGYTRSNSVYFTNNKKTSEARKIDVIKMLELYGIAKENLTIIKMNQLKNCRECVLYMKKYYCNDQEIKVINFYFK